MADGRVFTGRDAKERKLIDEIGNFQDAVDLTAKLAGISGKPRLIRLNRQRVTLLDVLTTDLSRLVPFQRAKHEIADSISIFVEVSGNEEEEQKIMTKADLVEEVAKVTELTRKDSEVIVDTLFDSVIKALKTGDKLEVRGFGSFRVRQRNARVGRNPKTGEKVEVPAKRVPYFKPSKELKDLINDGAAAGQLTPDPGSSDNP